MDIALGGDTFSDRKDLLKVAVAADRVGIKNFWMTEGMGRDAFAQLTELAEGTENIGLGTGIVNTFARTPTATAQAAATVMEVMGDRTFNLGLGSSGKALIEKFHGVPFDRPMARLEEFVQIIDCIFSTGRVPEPMEIFKTQGIKVGFDVPARERLKIFVAGLTPRSIAITGKYADGWLPIWPSKTRQSEELQTLLAAAKEAGRPAPEIAAYIYGVVSDQPDHIQLVRGTLAWYIARNGVVYRHMFERMGYKAEADEICELWDAGKGDEARHVVNQAMLEDTALMGELPEFEKSVGEFHAAGITRPVLRFPEGTPLEDMLGMLAKLERQA